MVQLQGENILPDIKLTSVLLKCSFNTSILLLEQSQMKNVHICCTEHTIHLAYDNVHVSGIKESASV